MNEMIVRVDRRTSEAQEICSFDLVPEHGVVLPAFTAGAHIDVHVAPGLIRQYSLCNDPMERNRYRIAVLRETASRGGSAGMHERVRVGDTLKVSAPKNLFPLVPAQRTLLLAGGIGITPILAMAQVLHASGKNFSLHYCGRSANRMAFIEQLRRSPFVAHVHVHTDDGALEQQFVASQVLAWPEVDKHLYVCGPGGFMANILETAQRLGWQDAQLHREYFAGVSAASGADESFTVRVASTGFTCIVPKGKSVVEVLFEHGVEVPVSCESGVCGTCLTGVLDGTPDHRDTYLTDAERANNDQFTPCCSRALSLELVLDL